MKNRLLITFLSILMFISLVACPTTTHDSSNNEPDNPGSPAAPGNPGNPGDQGNPENPDNPGDPQTKEGKIFFSFNMEPKRSVSREFSRTASITPQIPSNIIISLKNSLGDYTHKRVNFALYGTGAANQYITAAIDVPPGDYTLDEFIVLNDKTIIFVTPKTGSLMARVVKNPLGINISVTAGAAVKQNIEIVPCRNENLTNYGYEALDLKPVNIFENVKFPKNVVIPEFTGTIISAAQIDNYLYVLTESSETNAQVSVIDLSDHSAPVMIKRSSFLIPPLTSRGNFKFFFVDREAVYIIYKKCILTAPLTYLRILGNFSRHGLYDIDIHSFAVSKSVLYYTNGHRLYYLYPGAESAASFMETENYYLTSGILTTKDKLIVQQTYNGSTPTNMRDICKIYDLTQPLNPVLMKEITPLNIDFTNSISSGTLTGYNKNHFETFDDLIFCEYNNIPQVLQVNGSEVKYINGFNRTFDTLDMTVSSKYLFLYSENNILNIYSHNNGKDIKMLKSLFVNTSSTTFRKVFWINSKLYLVREGQLQVFDY